MTINIYKRLHEHLFYGLNTYSEKDWFVICLQGSQNYGLADEESDIDSKMLILPTFKDLVFNRKPVSHTLEIFDNKEHVDVKDTREYFKIFKKSNINFVEILFTDYWIANPKYNDLWLELLRHREVLARINPYAAVNCMKGMSYEKRKALDHEYPSRMHMINKYGYDPKQLSHLVRINYFLKRYIAEVPYKDCIYLSDPTIRFELLTLKRNGAGLNKEQAIELADNILEEIVQNAEKFCNNHSNENNFEADKILNNVLYQLISRSVKTQLT